MAAERWEWQNGTTDHDGMFAAATESNNGVILAGFTKANSEPSGAGDEVFTGNWVAIKLDAAGDLLWEWQPQDGSGDGGAIHAAVTADDDSVTLVGFTGGQTSNFSAAKLDADGNVLWQWQNGTSNDTRDAMRAAVVGGDNSVVMVGVSIGNYSQGDEWNAVAVKLDASGEQVWIWQNGSLGRDYFRAAAIGEDSSVVMAGYSFGSWGEAVFGGSDFVAVKLDADGNAMWSWQGGTEYDDYITCAVMGPDDSVVLAGYTRGNWSTENGGGVDFAAVKLDADGREVWRWQDGSLGDDKFFAGVTGEDDSITLAGYTNGDWTIDYDWYTNGNWSIDFDRYDRNWSIDFDTGDDFVAMKLDMDGNLMSLWRMGSEGSDRCWAMAAQSNGNVVLTGSSDGNWPATNNIGGSDAVAVLLETTTSSGTPAPSPAFTPVTTISLTQSEDTAPPTFGGDSASPARTAAPTSTEVDVSPAPSLSTPEQIPEGSSATITPMVIGAPEESPATIMPMVIGVVSAAVVVTLIVSAFFLRRRRMTILNPPQGLVFSPTRRDTFERDVIQSKVNRHGQTPDYVGGSCGKDSAHDGLTQGGDHCPSPTADAMTVVAQSGESSVSSEPLADVLVMHSALSGRGGEESGEHSSGKYDMNARGLANIPPTRGATTADGVDSHSRDVGAAFGGTAEDKNDDPCGTSCVGDHEEHTRNHVIKAVTGAATQLARECSIPCIREAAALVSMLVQLVSTHRGRTRMVDSNLRWCLAVVIMLKRAAKLLGQGVDIPVDADRVLLDDAHEAVRDLVQIMRAYHSKKKMSQITVSSLCKRRLEEAEAVVDVALSRLQLDSQVEVGDTLYDLAEDVKELQVQRHAAKGSVAEVIKTAMVEARYLRRKRNLDQLEIAENQLTFTGNLLGKGGFGEVYIVDYNGRNAAAKVLLIDQDIGETSMAQVETALTSARRESQRRAFLRELQAMIRLRSPHTVNVYGAVTSRKDRLILVMELLEGGDLRTFLRTLDGPLTDPDARRIVGDVCAGLVILHSKNTIHGDLKSANVLFDAGGRAKIGDFGTSRLAVHSNSTGLATHTTSASRGTQMSFAWTAPEVFDDGVTSYASDVYSFGVVVWEILTRALPWAAEARGQDIYRRVVIKGERPAIPVDAPADLAGVVRDCWAAKPGDRPTSKQILEVITVVRLEVEKIVRDVQSI